jgi:hypothetical protein
MLDGNQLTILVRALDEVNGDVGVLRGEEEEVGLTLVGDFCQLPPVKAPFAFESVVWDRFQPHVLMLETIKRQTDEGFVRALQAVRRGDAKAALETLQPCLAERTLHDYPGPTLLAKNDAVDRYNQLRLDTLKTPVELYRASRWGDQRTDWKQIPEELVLKPGALVMVLANCYDHDEERYRYVNGDLGTYEGKSVAGAYVTLQRTGRRELVDWITRENARPLEVGERKALKEAGLVEQIKEKSRVIGAVSYMPLRLAYATTVHKSQGLSLDRVQVNLREPFMAQGGMMYVALSRARSLEGLRIVGSAQTFVARCTVDERVRGWL